MVHRGTGQPSPTGSELVRRAVAGLRRKHGARPAGKTALVTAPLSAICVRLHALEKACCIEWSRKARPGAGTAALPLKVFLLLT